MCIDEIYGPKKDLILMDNNVLASNKFKDIITDIIDCGFHKGAIFKGRKRYIDFNQGLDLRLLTESKMKLLSKIAIKPIRIAFDSINLKEQYESKVRLSNKYGFIHLSNYILYNYLDKPKDFYDRLKINVLLNEELETKIYSFPMKYIPLDAKDRLYVGKYWNKKILRGIQCILLVTKGLVSPKKYFFEAAFGSSYREFLNIVYMPDNYIIYRNSHMNNGASLWKKQFKSLTRNEKNSVISILSKRYRFNKNNFPKLSSKKIKSVIEHYIF